MAMLLRHMGCPPNGFMHNNGQVPGLLILASIQQHNGTMAFVEPPYICRSAWNPLCVEGTNTRLLIYAVPLHAIPCDANYAINSLLP